MPGSIILVRKWSEVRVIGLRSPQGHKFPQTVKKAKKKKNVMNKNFTMFDFVGEEFNSDIYFDILQ